MRNNFASVGMIGDWAITPISARIFALKLRQAVAEAKPTPNRWVIDTKVHKGWAALVAPLSLSLSPPPSFSRSLAHAFSCSVSRTERAQTRRPRSSATAPLTERADLRSIVDKKSHEKGKIAGSSPLFPLGQLSQKI